MYGNWGEVSLIINIWWFSRCYLQLLHGKASILPVLGCWDIDELIFTVLQFLSTTKSQYTVQLSLQAELVANFFFIKHSNLKQLPI